MSQNTNETRDVAATKVSAANKDDWATKLIVLHFKKSNKVLRRLNLRQVMQEGGFEATS